MKQEGFQEVHTGRGFVLTKSEPLTPHGVPIRDNFCINMGRRLQGHGWGNGSTWFV